MPQLRIVPNWFGERKMIGKMDYTPLHATVDLLLDLYDDLKTDSLDDYAREEMADNIAACLATPGIAEVTDELDPEFFERLEEEVPDNVLNFPNSAEEEE